MQLDAFFGHVMKYLAISRAALNTTYRYLDPYADNDHVRARYGMLGYTPTMRALAAGVGAATREEHVRSVQRIAADLEAIAAETPAQRMRRYNNHARYHFDQVRDHIATDDPAVWPALAEAWRPMADLWQHVVNELMPDFDDVFVYLVRLDPQAFWTAYWHWMLHNLHEGLDNDVDTYIAELPQTVLERTEASDAACEAAFRREFQNLDDDDWSRLQADRARRALLATGMQIDPPVGFLTKG